MMNFRKTLLAGTALVAVAAFAAPGQALAACATTGAIAADCALQSNTTGAITLADGVDITLDTTGVVIGNTINDNDTTATSTITTSGTVTISQTAAIGTTDEIGSLTIASGGTWTSQASIETALGTNVNGTLTIDAAGASVYTNDAGGIEIGATGLVTIADSTTGTVQFGDAQGIDIAAGGELVIDDATGLTLWVVDGNAAGEGTLTINDGFTLTHALGTTALAEINIADGETLAAGANNVSATDISVGAGGALTLSSATVTGDIALGAGAGLTVSGAGTVTGDITGSTGAETLTLSGAVAHLAGAGHDIDLGSGNDTVAITGAALIDADTLAGGSGTDAITLNGASATISSDITGFETITVSSGNILTLGGSVASGTAISLAATNAQITYNAAGETLAGTVTGDGNVNKFTLTDGTVSATVDLAAGVDVVDINGGTISGTFSTGEGADTVTLSGATISGTLDGGTTIEDNISVDGSVTVSGTIQDVEAITFTDANQTLTVSGTGSLVTDNDGSDINLLAGAGGEILTFTGTSSYVGEIVGNAADVVNFGGTSHTTGGEIETVIVNVTAGTLTVDDILGGGAALADFNVSNGATVVANENITTAGDLANAGEIDIASGATVQAATYDSTVAGTWKLGVKRTGGTTNVGGLTLTGEVVDINLDTVEINVESGSQALVAGTYDAFLGSAGNATKTTADVVENSFFYNFALSEDDVNGDVDLVVTEATSLEAAAGTSNNYNAGVILSDDLLASTNTEINEVQTNLANASTQEEFAETLESTTPTVDMGFVGASMTVVDQTVGLTDTRLASLRTGDETGMAAGNVVAGLKGWGQAFGKRANQDRRGGIDGYDADTYGLALGMDTENLGANTVVGLAVSYGNTDVDSKNANTTASDIDTWQVTAYGSYDLDDRTYVNGQLSYAHNNIDQTRHNVGAISGLNADSSFDSNQYDVRAELGRNYEAGNGLTLTPSVMADYTHVNIDDYTETGAGGLNQTVNSNDLDAFKLGLGLDASWLHQNVDGSYLKPVLSAGYSYDLIGDNVETTSTFAAGGAAFKTDGFDPARHVLTAGAGLTYFSTTNWELSAQYNFEYKSDYDAHSGYLRAAYKF